MNQLHHPLHAILDRHALRRHDGIPTISVLTGNIDLSIQIWSSWSSFRNHRLVESADPIKAIQSWLECLASSRDLTVDAWTHLAARTRRPDLAQQATWESKSSYDVETMWEGLPLDRETDLAAAACHMLTQLPFNVTFPSPNQFASLLNDALNRFEPPWVRTAEAVSKFVPAQLMPNLLLAPDRSTQARDWPASSARLLATLVTHVPIIHVAVAVEQEQLLRFLESARDSQTHTLFREGTISVALPDEDRTGEPLPAADSGQWNTVSFSAVVEATAELAQVFDEAMQQRMRLVQAHSDEQARSAAERFLFELLEAVPQSRGRFELNGSLDFRFGPTNAEIDLLARDWRLAVEIDGFFHFRDPEAYRRDRRKDWELQRRGYFVVRVLADDVLSRTNEVLDRILVAVDHCSRKPSVARRSEA